jgi:hypothetical protein
MAEAPHDNTSPPVLATVKFVVWASAHVASLIVFGETTNVGGTGVAVGDGPEVGVCVATGDAVGDPRGAGDAVLPGWDVCVGACGAAEPVAALRAVAVAPPLEEFDEELALDDAKDPRTIEKAPR